MEGVANNYVNDIDNLKATELRLGLPGIDHDDAQSKMSPQRSNKRAFSENSDDSKSKRKSLDEELAPVAKVQIVGWPPIRSYRKNINIETINKVEAIGLYVKVSMDGAPYLRKIDIKVYKDYKELREALQHMFKCFSISEINEECNNSSDYAIAYEDKDGDLMLVGDVPWEMFINSCKRLRIMKGSEARGLGSS